MKTVTVNFHEVGRDKRSWSANFASPVNWRAVAKEAKATARLMSSEVEAVANDMMSAGEILVGGWRTVGTFTISQEAGK